MKKHLQLLVTLCLVCAVTYTSLAQGKATVVLTRKGNLNLITNKIDYSVNGVKVGSFQNKSKHTIELVPGEHTIVADAVESIGQTTVKNGEITITVADGETRYIGIKWPTQAPIYPTLIEYEKAEGEKVAEKLKPAKSIAVATEGSAAALDPAKASAAAAVAEEVSPEQAASDSLALQMKKFGWNYRDVAKQEYDKKYADISAAAVAVGDTLEGEAPEELKKLVVDGDPERATKLKKVAEEFPNLKYRRSSLYTLMINDVNRPMANIIKDAFGNAPVTEKYNDHNVGPYLIDGEGGQKDQTETINEYVKKNDLAKKMVAKWFNRSEKGGFNMDLIAERGQYNASEMDVAIANQSQRGTALLGDAGEELIKNTFLIVNDYKYMNKEELGEAASNTMAALGALGGNSKFGQIMSVASDVTAVAAKGYIIKTTSYLYQLNWNDSIAAVFYTEYWTDDKNLDEAKVKAFLESDIFSLKLVGSQSAWADVQSSIFTDKSDEDLIRISTVKATDKAQAKLGRKYPEFQTKTPLTSVEPLAAKIGLKEGIEAKDKFEVLEQTMNKEGKTVYKRKAIITVDKSQIWDNRFMAAEEMKASDSKDQDVDRTLFKGKAAGLYPGMLLRQIK